MMTPPRLNEQLLLLIALIAGGALALCLLMPGLQDYIPIISAVSFLLVGATALLLGSMGWRRRYRTTSA